MKTKFPGWRTMTGAQRRNAKARAIFAWAEAQGHTGLRSKRVTITLDLPGEESTHIEKFWTVREAEHYLATAATIDPDHLHAGHYSIDAPEEMVNPLPPDSPEKCTTIKRFGATYHGDSYRVWDADKQEYLPEQFSNMVDAETFADDVERWRKTPIR